MLVAPTATYLREFQHLHGRARAARYIHNGRKPDAFRRAPKANRVLAAGRLWDEGKNIAFLGRALQGSGIEFVVAGSTQGPSGEVASLKGARLLGPLPPAALARAMSEAAIFAAPARYEPFGLGVLEAALSGCALVLSDIPSLRELWEGVAHFIPPDDDAQWRKVIAYLTTDRERAIADGLAAQRRARRFEAGVMVEQYRQAYADTIAAAAGEEKAA